jgi:UTP--glucose-1-phosphate uridylyltransferase
LKAVLSAGGWGSRFFPVAKAVSKCLLPVLEKPILHHIVEECAGAGIQRIAVIVPGGPLGHQVRRYFHHDPAIAAHFRSRGWGERYEPLARLHELAEVTFVEQPTDGPYGTAVPPLLARDFVGDDDFFLINCDDLLLRFDGGSDLADLVTTRDAAGARAAIGATVTDAERAANYGVVFGSDAPSRTVVELRDKPGTLPPGRYEVTVGRALLPAEFLAYAARVEPSPATGEIPVTDAFSAYARDADLVIHRVAGDYFDCGAVAGWLAANVAVAEHRRIRGSAVTRAVSHP